MLNCKQLVQIVSSDESKSFSWRKKISVRFHLFICVNCRRYVQHLRLLRQAYRNLFFAAPSTESKSDIKKLENAIISRLKV